MEGMIIFNFEGMTLFKGNIWQLATILLFRSFQPCPKMPDEIFIDDTQIPKPNNMENDT